MNIDNNHCSIKIDYLLGNEDDFKVSLIGWQDGDYFKELSEEDGGVIAEHYQIFKNLPLGKKVDRETLNKIIDRFHI